MEGKIIWILYNNCIYCSEVKTIIKVNCWIDFILDPIIGKFDYISLFPANLFDSTTRCNACEEGEEFPQQVIASFNFDLISKYLI